MNTTLARITAAAAAFGAISAGAALATPAAHANPATDEAYVLTLRAEGIPGTDAALIGNGHVVCTAFAKGGEFIPVTLALATVAEITNMQAAFEVGAAVAAYCPAYQYLISGGGGQVA